MARNCIREPRYTPPVATLGKQADLFGGPTITHVATPKGLPKGWQRQIREWARCTVIADVDGEAIPLAESASAPPAIYLVACVAGKRDHSALARDLYTSPWFTKARAYIERQGAEWFILSAEHGLISPDQVIAPYDRTLSKMGAGARRLWGARVVEAMAARIEKDAPLIVLAGRKYREPIWPSIKHRASVPMEGLGIGDQLSWLKYN